MNIKEKLEIAYSKASEAEGKGDRCLVAHDFEKARRSYADAAKSLWDTLKMFRSFKDPSYDNIIKKLSYSVSLILQKGEKAKKLHFNQIEELEKKKNKEEEQRRERDREIKNPLPPAPVEEEEEEEEELSFQVIIEKPKEPVKSRSLKKKKKKTTPGYTKNTRSNRMKNKRRKNLQVEGVGQRNSNRSRSLNSNRGRSISPRRKKSPRRSRSKSPMNRNREKREINTRKKKKGKEKRQPPNPQSRFCTFCCEGNLGQIRNFLKHPNFLVEESDHRFGLHYAAWNERFEVCKVLIQSGKFPLSLKYHGVDVVSYAKDGIVKSAIKVFHLLHFELQKIIALDLVKEHLYALANKIILDKKRERLGKNITKKSYDMIFYGNPGTGKTSIASVICKIYNAFGIITKPELKSVQRPDLVGATIGSTGLKTRAVIKEQEGGILLVDEAYRLSGRGEKDFGKEAIEELMASMNGAADIIFIFAGYEDKMKQYMQTNDGLFRRISYHMKFVDYSSEEIAQIFMLMIRSCEYNLSEKVSLRDIVNIINKTTRRLRASMNGGLAKKLLERAIEVQNEMLSLDAKDPELSRIDRKHIEIAIQSFCGSR